MAMNLPPMTSSKGTFKPKLFVYLEKTCTHCGLTKTTPDFPPNRNVCKKCKCKMDKEYNRKNYKPKERDRAATIKLGEQHPQAKLTADDTALIRLLCAEYREEHAKFQRITKNIGPKALAEKFGVSVDTISKIARRETWTHV